MNMQVNFKAFQLGKAFIRCLALVLFLSCMNSHVMQQIIGLGETFPANFTLYMAFFLCECSCDALGIETWKIIYHMFCTDMVSLRYENASVL